MEKNLKKNTYICMYIYKWITLLYTWNTVKQLYFNLKKIPSDLPSGQNKWFAINSFCNKWLYRKWFVSHFSSTKLWRGWGGGTTMCQCNTNFSFVMASSGCILRTKSRERLLTIGKDFVALNQGVSISDCWHWGQDNCLLWRLSRAL